MPERQAECQTCREVWRSAYSVRYSAVVADAIEDPDEGYLKLPARQISINQLAGFNLAYFRKSAGLTQEELGKRLGGWTKVAVSAAERSWDGKRIRKFDADELAAIAVVLGIPLIALFLPPPDTGITMRYVVKFPGEEQEVDLMTVLPRLVSALQGGAQAYRDRLYASGVARLMESEDMDTAARVLALAQQTADQALADARQEADDLLRKAQQEADDLLSEADRRASQITGDAKSSVEAVQRDAQAMDADQVIADARREADETLGRARRETDDILSKARRQAERITGDALERALSLERDAQDRHRQAMGSLVKQREELERRVGDLQRFEREYRSRFIDYLQGLMDDLKTGAGDDFDQGE